MKRVLTYNVNTSEHWNKSYKKNKYPYPGYDTYLTLFHYYIPLLEQLKYIDRFTGSTVLDFGCGNADRFRIIDISHINYSGLDHSNEIIEYNKSIFPEINWYSDIENVKEKPDYIISLHTLEHLDDPQQTLVDLIFAAKKGVFVQVPYQDSFLSEEHLWQFDEYSFKVDGIEPVVIPGLIVNIKGDREMFMAFIKNRDSNSRVILDMYRFNKSPQAWFLEYAKRGYVNYYCFNVSGIIYLLLKRVKKIFKRSPLS